MKRIFEIQQELSVEKDERQANYTYRTLQSTLKALLPLLGKKRLIMTLPCSLECGTNGNYVVAVCNVYDAESGDLIAVTSYCTKDENAMIKGGQGTGAAATYAKKGAVDSMFLLDAKNPELLDLDNHDALQAVADKTEDTAARAYEKKVAVVIQCFNDAATLDDLRSIVNANPDVVDDKRVLTAGANARARINKAN